MAAPGSERRHRESRRRTARCRPKSSNGLLSPEPWAAGRRRYGGLTLGLGLARSLVELHGGTFSVQRTDRGAALFEVTLPRG